MIYPPPPPPVIPRLHRRSLGLAIISGLALLLAGGAAVLLFMNAQSGRRLMPDGLSLPYAWILGAVALLQIPGLVYSLARLGGKPLAEPRGLWSGLGGSTLLVVIAWPLVVVGNLALGRSSGAVVGLLSGLLQLLAVGIPLLWLVQIGRRGLQSGSAQRAWGVVGVSTAITVPLIIILEALGAVVLGVLALLILSAQEPGLLAEIERLITQINLGRSNPTELLALLSETISPRQISFGALAGVAVLAPLVEELLKPLALWALVRKDFTPAQGFSAGLVAGACFALMESLQTTTMIGSTQGPWVMSVALRVGTGAVHIACSGLVGWGLGEAWKNGRYLRLGGLFLLALGIHGTWNALALGPALNSLLGGDQQNLLGGLSLVSAGGLVALLLLSLGVLAFGSRILRQTDVNHGDTEVFPGILHNRGMESNPEGPSPATAEGTELASQKPEETHHNPDGGLREDTEFTEKLG